MRASAGTPTLLHVIDTTGPGGAETVFVELADRTRDSGYRSVSLIRGPGWVRDSLAARSLETRILEAKGSFNINYLRSLVRLIHDERVTIIQSHLLGSSIYCALAGLITGTPVVATFHGMVDVNSRERFLALKRLVLHLGVSRFVTVSRALGETLARERLISPKNSSVIFNGIETSKYVRAPTGWIHSLLGLPSSSRLAISIGNVRPAKDYENLCRAAAIVCVRFPNLHFVIAGDSKSPLMSGLDTLRTELHIKDRVHFIGFQHDPAAVLAEGSLFVLSSSTEGFSISTIEALAAGLPVVVTASGGPEEIVTNGEHGILVPPANPDALALGIEEILASDERTEHFRAKGRLRCEQHFGVESMVKAYTELYARFHSQFS